MQKSEQNYLTFLRFKKFPSSEVIKLKVFFSIEIERFLKIALEIVVLRLYLCRMLSTFHNLNDHPLKNLNKSKH